MTRSGPRSDGRVPQVVSSLFHSYDVRGRYPQDLGPAQAEAIASAISDVFPGPYIIARDTRSESRKFERAFIRGMRSGADGPLRVGVQPTPVVAYLAGRYHCYSFVVTPSHNASGYTGLKGFKPSGESIGGEWVAVRTGFERYIEQLRPNRPTPLPSRLTTRGRVGSYRLDPSTEYLASLGREL